MSLQAQIINHLECSGQSMRALSMSAGLNPKAVADILNRPGHRPNKSTSETLGAVMGCALSEPEPQMSYAQLIVRLSEKTGNARLAPRSGSLNSNWLTATG